MRCPGYTERAGIIAVDPEFGYTSHLPLCGIAGRFGHKVADLYNIPIPLSPYDGAKCMWHIPFLGEEIEQGHLLGHYVLSLQKLCWRIALISKILMRLCSI